jgi:hypothetical protein
MARSKKDEPAGSGPEPPEGTAAATDGEPNADELARRRRERNGARSMSERMADGEGQDSDEPELFPLGTLSGDPKVTVKNLIRAGARVTCESKMSSAAVPNPSGHLFDPEREVQVLVRVLPGAAKQTPIHEKQADGTYKVKEWKIGQELAVIHVQPAEEMFTREQVVDLFHEAGVASAVVSRLLGEPPSAAEG